MQPGQLYNAEDGRKALRDVFALGLFDNVQIFPRPNQKDESKVCTASTLRPSDQPCDGVAPAILLWSSYPFLHDAMPELAQGL